MADRLQGLLDGFRCFGQTLPSAAAGSSAKQNQDVLVSKDTTSDHDQEMEEEKQGEQSSDEDMDLGLKPSTDQVDKSESGSSTSGSDGADFFEAEYASCDGEEGTQTKESELGNEEDL